MFNLSLTLTVKKLNCLFWKIFISNKFLCRAAQRENNQGLGVASAEAPDMNDNEYDAYRKRMMMAYRFRPNPLVSFLIFIFFD